MSFYSQMDPKNPFGFFPAGTPLGFHHSPFSLVPNPTANPLLQHQQQNQSQEGHPPPAAAPLPPPPSSQQQPINMTPQDSGRYIRSNEAPLSPQTPQPQAQSSSSSSSHLHHPPSHSDQPPRLPPLPQQQTHSPPWTGKLESKSGSDDEALDATMNRLTEPKNSNSMRDKQTILFDSAGKKVYACTICDFQTKQKGLLKVHINSVHYKMKIWSCDLCKFTSVQKGNLRAHVLTVHEKVRNFACDFCDYRAGTKGILKTHVKNKHLRMDRDTYDCNVCDYKAVRKCHLRDHIKNEHHHH